MTKLVTATILCLLLFQQGAIDQINIAIDALNKAKALLVSDTVYQSITDRVVRTKPALPVLGAAGFVFTEPTFNNRMMRVTDPVLGTGSWRVPSNAHVSGWSSNSKRFSVVGENGVRVYNFDAAAFKATLTGMPYSQAEPSWSRTDPDVLYTIGGPQTRTIRKWSAPTGNVTDLLDLDTLGLPDLLLPRTYIGTVIAAGTPEAVVAMFGGKSQDDHHYVIRIVGSNYTILDTVSRMNFRLHGTSVDLTGRWVFLYPRDAVPYQVVIWDTMTGSLTPITNAMFPFGHDAQGYGTWVNQDVSTGTWDAAQWQFRTIANLATPANLITPVLTPPVVYMADHTNWNNAKPDKLLPVCSGMYRYPVQWTGAPPIAESYWRAWDDEIICIATTGPSTVWRFAHTRSDVRDETGPKNPDGSSVRPYFWYEPIVNVDPSGKFILFTSNWEKSLGLDPLDPPHFRQDVFLLALR